MDGKLKNKNAFPNEPGDGVGPQVKIVRVIEIQKVPSELKGTHGVCRNLKLIGDENHAGASVPGCSAANCPLGARGELTLAGPSCDNYNFAGQSGVKGKSELPVINLDMSTLASLKASEVPAALCRAASPGGDYGC